MYYDVALQIPLSQRTGFRFEQRWVNDYYFRVGQFGRYFYAYDLE